MANNTINMSKLRQILRLHTQKFSKLQIALQTGVSRNTLKKYILDFNALGVSFEELNTLSDQDLEALFIKTEETEA
jgi:response regulator of citrate/malate metabolism